MPLHINKHLWSSSSRRCIAAVAETPTNWIPLDCSTQLNSRIQLDDAQEAHRSSRLTLRSHVFAFVRRVIVTVARLQTSLAFARLKAHSELARRTRRRNLRSSRHRLAGNHECVRLFDVFYRASPMLNSKRIGIVGDETKEQFFQRSNGISRCG